MISEHQVKLEYTSGLREIDSFSHALIIFFMHQLSFNAESDLVRRPRRRVNSLSFGGSMSTRRAEFLAGVKATIPLLIGAFPFGVIFGALSINAGISPLGTVALSLFVFAGSAQFIGVGLVAGGASIPVIVLTTFVVNLRHALYSATLAPYVKHLSQRWLLPLGYMLTDEAFVTAVTHYAEAGDSTLKHWYFLGSELVLFICWQIFTLIGIVAGSQIKDANNWGLDFALYVTFTGMLVPLVKNRPTLAAVVVAALTAVLTNTMPNKIGLLIATLAGVAAGVIVEARFGVETEPLVAPEESVL